MFEYHTMLFMYDYTNNTLPKSFTHFFQTHRDINTRYLTRQSNNYYIPKSKSLFASKLPTSTFPQTWNKWTIIVNPECNRHTFKKQMKEALINSYSSEVKCNYSGCTDCNKQSQIQKKSIIFERTCIDNQISLKQPMLCFSIKQQNKRSNPHIYVCSVICIYICM